MVDFSPSRLVQALPVNYFANMNQRVADYTQRGIDIINLEKGNPDQPTPDHIVAVLEKAARLPENHGYPPFGGKRSVREAIAAFYKREYQVDIDPETEITMFCGAQIAIAALPQVLLNPGDVMVTTDPAYPLYFSAARLAGAGVHTVPVDEEDDFLPDWNKIPSNVLAKTGMLVMNYPNNPTGAMATEAFFADTLTFAKAHRLPIVHDFAYGAFGFDGKRPLSFLQTPGAKEYGVEIYTMSKTYNMAGWRFGFLVGNASVIQAFKRFHDNAHSDVFGAIEDAAAAALLGPQDCVKELNALYERRRDVLVASLRDIGWDVKAPKGSFFNWFKVPKGYTSETFVNALFEKAHVAMAPGLGFGKSGDQYVRASLLEPEERLREAAARIQKAGFFQKLNV